MSELYHGIPKGGTKKNAKYYKRIVVNGKYKYFYSAFQYSAYLKGQKVKQTVVDVGNKAIKAIGNKLSAGKTAKNMSSQDKARADKVVATAKKADAQNYINKEETAKATEEGNKKIEEMASKSSSASSKKSGSSGSSSSKSSKTGGVKGTATKSSSSKKDKESTAKKESTSSKAGTSTKTSASDTAKDKQIKELQKQVQQLTEKKERVLTGGVATTDSLKKLYGVSESNKHATVQESIDKMKSYPDGSYGYINAGGTMYKWSKEDGKITFRDNNTDKEVALQVAVQNVEEFRTDKKKKNNTLSHSFKGTSWKNHKYIKKEGKRYYYKESRVDDNGTHWDKYQNPDTKETINVNTDFKYNPARYDAEKLGNEVIGKLFKKKKKTIKVIT